MNLLAVANFDRDVGYAWGTIQAVLDRVAAALTGDGMRFRTCYPDEAGGLWSFLRLLRRERVRILYLTDRPTWSWRYPFYHIAGVRRIVVHDRTSGTRTARAGPTRAVKRLLHRVPWLAVDRAIGVSDFVVRRLIAVNGMPPGRTRRIYNGIDLSRFGGTPSGRLHQVLGLARETPIVFVSGRAQPYKGVPTLIDAAGLLQRAGRCAPDLTFVYCGDGPALAAFKDRAARAGVARFHFLGRRDDVPQLLADATVAVVPSVWAEAFGLTVIEAMAARVAVIATRTGGIPELVDDGVTGLLVPPGAPAELADALERLLGDAALRTRLVERAHAEVLARFAIERTVEDLRREILAVAYDRVSAPR